MPSLKILALPFLAQVKILESLDFPDLIRFANCSTKCSNLLGSANPIDLKSSFRIKEKGVTVTIWVRNGDKREYKFVVNEINYNRENGFKWIGLGGFKFFECPGIGKTWDFLGGPPEDEFEDSDFESDNDSVNQNADDGAKQVSDCDEVSEDGSIEDESEGSEDGSDDEQDTDIDTDSDDEEFHDVPIYDVGHPNFQKYYCQFSSPTGQSVFEVADLLITHLFKLFKRFEVGHLSLRPTDASKQLVEKHEKLQKCDGLAIVDFSGDFDHHRPLTKELLVWSIESIEPRGCAYFCGVIGEFMYEKGFKTERMEIHDGLWVHQNAILDSETKTLFFYCHLPSSSYINTIFKEWVSNEKMKYLKKIQWEARGTGKDITEQFRKEVMDGIPEVIPTDEEREAIEPEFHKMIRRAEEADFTKFFRRVDGKLAVVFVNIKYSIYNFLTV